MKNVLNSALLLALVGILITKTDAFWDLVGYGVNRAIDAMIKSQKQKLNPPSNIDDSIQYMLYTPSNRYEPCLIQPIPEQFDKCPFNAGYETKFLIYGLFNELTPGDLFDVLKDALLNRDDYNVIVVNWDLYNVIPFQKAYNYSRLVGDKVGEMMAFLESHANVSLKTVHCIGHSLGANVCGQAGRNVQKLGRISGLDPEGMSFIRSMTPDIRLTYKDADFVDAIHTSSIYSGFGCGMVDPIGHLDFYPNGGVDQIPCTLRNEYKMFSGKTLKVRTLLDKVVCNHLIPYEYFINSVNEPCKFLATECPSYSDFQAGECSNGITAKMGFYSEKIPGIPYKTKFYLTTLQRYPYCKLEE